MIQGCFKKGCEFEAQYVCLCLCCETYSCEFHLRIHLSLLYRSHAFDSIHEELHNWTKDGVLEFLEKEKSKKEKLKKIVKSSFSQYFCEGKRLDSDLEQINSLIEQVSHFSEQNPLLNLSNFQNDSDNAILPEDSEPYNSVQLFCRLNQLRLKTYEILNRGQNDEKIEQEFRKTCTFYQNYTSDPLLSQALQDYINAYKRISSLLLLDMSNKGSNLLIYDIETDREEIQILEPPAGKYNGYLITTLPNGELFYRSTAKRPSLYFIIDRDYKSRQLPYGNKDDYISAIYFKGSIYCFGKYASCRFDLDRNRWIKWDHIPKKYYDCDANSIIFNNNILFSYQNSGDLFLYSFEIDTFSEIPFLKYCVQKIFTKSNERVYAIGIGTNYLIYESDVENAFSWKEIGMSIINYDSGQEYFSYNKGGIYIAFNNFRKVKQYFKFDLSKKKLIEIACYREHIALKKFEGKIDVLKFDGQNFNINPDYTAKITYKRYSLNYLCDNLEKIELKNLEIEQDHIKECKYIQKGMYLCDLEWYLDALECYDKATEIFPDSPASYFHKGEALRKMGLYLEAIEFYNQGISIFKDKQAYIGKGLALHDWGRYQEAIECYNAAVDAFTYAFLLKGEALYALDKYAEALECYKSCLDYNSRKDILKGKVLCKLDRKIEAIECYSKLIRSESNMFFFYCCRANVLNDVGREEEAMQDFNQAYYLMPIKRVCFFEEKFPDWNYNFIDEAVVQDFFELMKTICRLEENAVKFKEEIQKLKDTKNGEILKEVEEKETLIKEMRSKILNKAVECLDSSKNASSEVIQQVEKEADDHIKATINTCLHLCSLLSIQ